MQADVVDVDALSRAEVVPFRTHAKFLLKQLSFTQQFSHMYYGRLARLTPRVLANAERALGADTVRKLGHSRILQLKVGTRAIIVGTLYKQLVSVSTFLRDYTKELVKIEAGGADDEGDDEGGDDDDDAISDPGLSTGTGQGGTLVSDADCLIAEDDSGRVEITGLPPVGFVTGVVVAVLGTLEEKGKFRVDNCVYPGAAPPRPRAFPAAAAHQPCYIAIVSGLQVNASGQVAAATQMLVDFVSGQIGDAATVARAARIARLVVGGNIVEPTDDARLKSKIRLDPADHVKPNYDRNASTSANAMRHADQLLRELAAAVELDVMPGDLDPSNCFLPQQPIHPLLLRSASRQTTLKLVTNPYEVTFVPLNDDDAPGTKKADDPSGCMCLFQSGQCLEDVLVQSQLGPLEAMERMLQWGLMAPTAPNTLACYPFKDMDPFVIDTTPHVFVSCNHREGLQTSLVKHPGGGVTRLIAVPEFHRAGQVVLLDINSPTLDVTYETLFAA
jgi:DNA polymerase delta subunit 2